MGVRRIVLIAIVGLGAGAAGCATGGATKSGADPTARAGDPMIYGGGDGTSCAEAVVIKEKTEMAGVAAEYRWLAARYPGYQKRLQALARCDGRPADKVVIMTTAGEERSVYFDISGFFGASLQ